MKLYTKSFIWQRRTHRTDVWGKKYDVIPEIATVQEKAMCVLRFFETKSVIKTQNRYRMEYGKDVPSNNATRINFGDGYLVMKQRFIYQGG
jgi:hypothetical protein